MLNNEAQAGSGNLLLNPASYASTAAASTGSWIDIRYIEGDLLVVQTTGGVNGSLQGRLETAQSAAGASAASVNFNEGEFLTVGATGNVQTRSVCKASLGGWIRYRGYITTGPAFISAAAVGRPKNL